MDSFKLNFVFLLCKVMQIKTTTLINLLQN